MVSIYNINFIFNSFFGNYSTMKQNMSSLFVMVVLQVFSVIYSAPIRAEIVQITSIHQIVPSLVPGSLVAFDLDNTVMMPPQTLGTDQWFDHLVQANLAQGYDSALAVTEAVRTWISVQKVTRMLPVERTTPSLIHQLQAEGYLVIALTARPPELHDVTVRQLASIGVRFQQVLSIGPTQSKGDAMKTFLATATSRISRVIFIDDKQKHVDTVNSSLNSLGGAILHTEYRYGATDNKVRAYNANVAECEWKIFEQTQTLVSDSACGGN